MERMPLGCRSGGSRRQGVGDPGGAQRSFAGVNTGGPPSTLRIWRDESPIPQRVYVASSSWEPPCPSCQLSRASSASTAICSRSRAARRPVDGAGLIRVHGPTSSAAGSRRTTWPDTACGHIYSESTPMSSTRCSPSSLQRAGRRWPRLDQQAGWSARAGRASRFETARRSYAALGSRSSARSVIATPSAVATSQILARLAAWYPVDS